MWQQTSTTVRSAHLSTDGNLGHKDTGQNLLNWRDNLDKRLERDVHLGKRLEKLEGERSQIHLFLSLGAGFCGQQSSWEGEGARRSKVERRSQLEALDVIHAPVGSRKVAGHPLWWALLLLLFLLPLRSFTCCKLILERIGQQESQRLEQESHHLGDESLALLLILRYNTAQEQTTGNIFE